jgi:hypothetical protein
LLQAGVGSVEAIEIVCRDNFDIDSLIGIVSGLDPECPVRGVNIQPHI